MIDGAPLTKPIELPKRTAMNKGTNGTKVPLDDDAICIKMYCYVVIGVDVVISSPMKDQRLIVFRSRNRLNVVLFSYS